MLKALGLKSDIGIIAYIILFILLEKSVGDNCAGFFGGDVYDVVFHFLCKGGMLAYDN